MKKVFRTISFCLLIAVMLMCAAQAEEITLGQPFDIKLVLPQSSAAKELRVTLNEMTSNNMGLRFGSRTGMTPAQPYAGYMQNNQLYLFSEQGFAAGEIGSMTVTLEGVAQGVGSFYLSYSVYNGNEMLCNYVDVFHVSGQAAGRLAVGDHIFLGSYEQDNNLYNGQEPLEWRVLSVEGNRALVISEKVLDQKYYHPKQTAVTWETCWLRQWLNSDFINTAFSLQEQQQILLSTVPGHVSPYYNTESSLLSVGNDTQDRLFLLSAQEANQYFANNQDRIAYPTQSLVARDQYLESTADAADWLMRQPHKHRTNTACVSNKGATSNGVNVSHALSGLRPAMWIKIQ